MELRNCRDVLAVARRDRDDMAKGVTVRFSLGSDGSTLKVEEHFLEACFSCLNF